MNFNCNYIDTSEQTFFLITILKMKFQIITCGLGGEWSGKAPICRYVDCGTPVRPDRGSIQLVNGTTTVGSVVKYQVSFSTEFILHCKKKKTNKIYFSVMTIIGLLVMANCVAQKTANGVMMHQLVNVSQRY